jgi:hypothetical protein
MAGLRSCAHSKKTLTAPLLMAARGGFIENWLGRQRSSFSSPEKGALLLLPWVTVSRLER